MGAREGDSGEGFIVAQTGRRIDLLVSPRGPRKVTKGLWPPRFLAIIFSGCSRAPRTAQAKLTGHSGRFLLKNEV
jgi:hypothetical protein